VRFSHLVKDGGGIALYGLGPRYVCRLSRPALVRHARILGDLVRRASPEDVVCTDRITGKQSLIGMFSVVPAVRFPVTLPQLCVHVSLTEGYGRTEVIIRIVDANDARPPIVGAESAALEREFLKTFSRLARRIQG